MISNEHVDAKREQTPFSEQAALDGAEIHARAIKHEKHSETLQKEEYLTRAFHCQQTCRRYTRLTRHSVQRQPHEAFRIDLCDADRGSNIIQAESNYEPSSSP